MPLEKIGLRGTVIFLFLALYLGSLLVINAFFVEKYRQSSEILQNLQFGESLSVLSFSTEQDTLKARELLNKFNSSRAASEMICHETQIYSTVYLFLLMIISVSAFIIILYAITKPLKQMQRATSKIGEGDFSVQLPETGFKEIKELKASFNRMSRELENVQKKLIRAEKESIWKELSRILAHEIKNPLTPIQLTIQRLEEKYELEPQKFAEIFPDSVKIINQEINNLQKLAYSFSSFAKDIEPEFSDFNLRSCLEEILASYRHRYNIELSCATDQIITFDRTHFYQVITNILQNAIDATEDNSKITICCEEKDNKTVISIADNGKGIEEEFLQKIFEPYFTMKKKGTGLGLALVKKLVELNNAEIGVESEIEKGTTFKIVLNKD
ncbi:MAG: ATP-binding protein [Candidatus Cloacimonadales bacterium]|nr:ATP-binding protein [Candidatus Cloacimonadales bacterium]